MKINVNLTTSYKKYINEAQTATSDEYYEYSAKLYPHLIDFIKQGDDLGKSIAGSEIITLKSDTGNLIVRYIVGSVYVIILGAVTRDGKLTKGDVEDLRKWIDELVDYIEEGKTILTSPNELSEPLLQKALLGAKKRGIEMDIHKNRLPISDDSKNLNWVNYQIKRKNTHLSISENVNIDTNVDAIIEYIDYRTNM